MTWWLGEVPRPPVPLVPATNPLSRGPGIRCGTGPCLGHPATPHGRTPLTLAPLTGPQILAGTTPRSPRRIWGSAAEFGLHRPKRGPTLWHLLWSSLTHHCTPAERSVTNSQTQHDTRSIEPNQLEMADTVETAPPPSGPVAVSVPDAPEFLSEAQWKVLMAIMDTVIPAVRVQDSSANAKQQDSSTIYLPSGDYSETAIKLRNASTPLNHSSDVLEAYLAERPSDNPAFAQLLKSVLSNVPPHKQKEMRLLLSILKYGPSSQPFLHPSLTAPAAPAQEASSSPPTPPHSPLSPSPSASRSSKAGAPPPSGPSNASSNP